MDRPTSSGPRASDAGDPAAAAVTGSGDTTPAGASAERDVGDARGGLGARFRDVKPGDSLGRYELLEEIGAGGMATVFRARDTQLRRAVAVKVLHAHLARRREIVVRFLREARAAAKLDHPGVVRVLDVGGRERADTPDDEPPFIVLDLIVGTTLDELAKVHAPLLGEIVAAMGILIADALADAHRAGIVHRDIKPSNLLVSSDGRLLLADFGVARLDDDEGSLATRTGALLGTPSFMSPEQASGHRVDRRSDLYSLGATLYQLATGATPYGGNTAKVIASIATGDRLSVERRNPAVGGELAQLIERTMAVEVAERPQSADELSAGLSQIIGAAGLPSAADIVAQFITAPAQSQLQLRKQVLAATLAEARRAQAKREYPRAMALASRAFALDPESEDARSLVDDLGRRWQTRRRNLGLAVALALVAGSGFAGLSLLSGDPPEQRAAILPTYGGQDGGALTLAGPLGDGGMESAAAAIGTSWLSRTVVGDPTRDRGGIDAGGAAVVVTRDAGVPIVGSRRRPDAGSAPSPGSVSANPVALDAGPAQPPVSPVISGNLLVVGTADAGSPQANAAIGVVADAWCDLSIDGVGLGRLDPARRYPVSSGSHEIACAQGPGLARWSTVVALEGGEFRRLSAQLFAPVKVTLAIEGASAIRVSGRAVANGQRLELAPGRYRVEVERTGQATRTGWVSLPRVSDCTLRDHPNLDCYR